MCGRCANRFFVRLHRNDAGILEYCKEFLCDMTENSSADAAHSRQAGFVRYCLNMISKTIIGNFRIIHIISPYLYLILCTLKLLQIHFYDSIYARGKYPEHGYPDKRFLGCICPERLLNLHRNGNGRDAQRTACINPSGNPTQNQLHDLTI